MQNKEGGTTKYVVDINKHGIRRDRPAVGYKAVKALNKKLANKNKKKKWLIYTKILIYL